MQEGEQQTGNLSPEEQREYKTLVGTPAHLRSEDQMSRFGELCGRANYWDHVAISPPAKLTHQVIAHLRKIDNEWRAYSSSAYYADEDHCGYDENGKCDSDSYYYLISTEQQAHVQTLVDGGLKTDWCWITVKTAPLGEPAGPIVGFGEDDA